MNSSLSIRRSGDAPARRSVTSLLTGKRLAIASLVVAAAGVTTTEVHASAPATCARKAPEALVKTLGKQAPALRTDVLRLALNASQCAAERGLVKRRNILTVIDYSLPSSQPRLFVFDTSKKTLLFHELVAHGKNSGSARATKFSNVNGSLATSLGLFVTANTYMGSNGYSLRMKGLEKGVNDRAWERAIVMHGAKYVNAASAAKGWIGRSWGCPAVPTAVARQIIDTVKGGSAIFAYYPDQQWLASSSFLGGQSGDTGRALAAR